LTERELDILRDLPSLLSLRDIAAAHVVSLNTVKTHLKAVYRKLGASSRREAVDHARELGLL
jgi:LuxR family maltose regulon positive regulatory protein